MTTRPKHGSSLVVLGLGNILCGDDGLGVAAIELLQRTYKAPDNARVLDGGTLGLALLAYIDASDDVILVDAVRTDDEPGAAVRLDGDDVLPAVRERLSCHQIGVADLLDGLRLLDDYPKRLMLLGLVPDTLQLGLGLSSPVNLNLPLLVEQIAREAERLGYEFVRKPSDETSPTGSGVLAAGLPGV